MKKTWILGITLSLIFGFYACSSKNRAPHQGLHNKKDAIEAMKLPTRKSKGSGKIQGHTIEISTEDPTALKKDKTK